MLRRIGVLASLAVVATMFAGISSAQAQGPTAGVCIFDGLSGELQPDGIQDAVPDILDAANLDGSPLDVERGSFSYTSGGVATGIGVLCAGVFAGSGPDIGGALVGTPLEISSEGYYDNIVCGTGFAHDLDGSNTTVSGTGVLGTTIDASGAGYEIPFVAGVGPLLIGPDGAPALSELSELLPSDGSTHAPDGVGTGVVPGGTGIHGVKSSPFVGVGAVQITPGNSTTGNEDNCILSSDLDTDEFEVRGFFVAAG